MIDVPEIWHQYVYYSGNSRTMALPNILKCMVLSYVLFSFFFFFTQCNEIIGTIIFYIS